MPEPTTDDLQHLMKKVLVSIAEKEHSIDHQKISATTTSKKVTFKVVADKVFISTDALCFVSYREHADTNRDIRLQAGQSINLEGVNVRSVAAVTTSGTANVDVIGLTRVR